MPNNFLDPFPQLLLAAISTSIVAWPFPSTAKDAAHETIELQQIGTVTHEPMREVSGLIKSRTYEGVFWAICDSGNPPHLYAIDRTGKLLAEFRVNGVTNLDWEAISIDDTGFLFIGDVGNNRTRITPNGLPSRRVIQIREPNPLQHSVDHDLPRPEIPLVRICNHTFPGDRFDCEAIFAWRTETYGISKVIGQPTRLYRLPCSKEGPAPVVEICELPEVFTVTDAALSRDGRRLAVASYTYAALFELDPSKPLGQLAQATPKIVNFSAATSIESCSWDGDDLILVSEKRQVYSMRFTSIASMSRK